MCLPTSSNISSEKYCASDNEEEIRIGVDAVKETLTSNYFRHDEAKQGAVDGGTERPASVYRPCRGALSCEREQSTGPPWTTSATRESIFPEEFFTVAMSVCSKGVYGRLSMLNSGFRKKVRRTAPFTSLSSAPCRLARFDLDEYIEGRQVLSRSEWIDLLLRSVGLEPTRMEQRLKLLLLTRLIPFVEKNYNFIELGPRGTGKSYAFSEMSPYCMLISGGKASTANLFYNNARRQVGLVGHWDVVAFDEVGGMKITDPDAMQIMKDYMANGRFSRGVTQVLADASLVFVGNLNQPVESLVQNSANGFVPAIAEGIRPGAA